MIMIIQFGHRFKEFQVFLCNPNNLFNFTHSLADSLIVPTIDRLSIIWRSEVTDKMKRSFFQAAVVSKLLYGCTTWTLTKRLEKKLDGNYTRMLRAILNKSWRQHPKRYLQYSHLPPITKTIQVRGTRHAGHCWRSRDELISDVLQWTTTYDRAKAGRPARTYIQQLCEDTGYSPEHLPEKMNDREKWRERVRDILASDTTWWWWLLGITNNSIKHLSFVYTQLNDQTVLFIIIRFYINPLFVHSLNGNQFCLIYC